MSSVSPDTQAPIRRDEAALAVLFVAVAIACQAWHPLWLGFYHDDWALFVQPRLHPQDFHFLGTWHLDRPGYSIFSKLMLTLWDGRTTTFHLVKIAINLATAGAIAWTCLVYQKSFAARSIALAASAAAFWLVAPWSLGYSLWPTAAFTNSSVLFLCVAAIVLARWTERGKLAFLVLAVAAFGVSVFIYQSAWLGIFPFALALLWRAWREGRALRPLVIAFLVLGAVQLASAIVAWLYSTKTPNPHVFALFRANLKQTAHLGVEAFGATGNAWLTGGVAMAAIVAAVLLWRRGGPARTRSAAALMLMLTGLIGTSAVYASASYGIATTGLFSRTTQMVDFWLAVGGAILFAPAPADKGAYRYIGLAQSLVVVGFCALAYWPAARPWVRSWQLQQAILARTAPLADALREGDAVLCDVPMKLDGITVFGAPWDITGGVLVRNADRRPDLAHTFPRIQIIPPLDLDMSWTPGTFTIAPGWTVPAKRLLVWHWQSGKISAVDHPVTSRAGLVALLQAN